MLQLHREMFPTKSYFFNVIDELNLQKLLITSFAIIILFVHKQPMTYSCRKNGSIYSSIGDNTTL